MELTTKGASHVIVGGGVLGLSTAWRLAERGADVLVLEKDRVGAGASGAAGGIVRNYYRSAAITDLIRQSVEIFEAEPEAYGFRQVGYLAAVPRAQVDDLVAIREHHDRVGYESELIVGAERCREYLAWTWPDWEAEVEAVLHERRGGWADPMRTVRHLAARARAAGATIAEGVEVTGFELGPLGVEAVLTERGPVRCEVAVVAPGPWAAADLGDARPGRRGRGRARRRRRAHAARRLLEGTGGRVPAPRWGHGRVARATIRRSSTSTSRRRCAPIVTARCSQRDRGGSTSASIATGRRSPAAGCRCCSPIPTSTPTAPTTPPTRRSRASRSSSPQALAVAIGRFRGRSAEWRATLAGGIVSHTPDNYPVCDWVLPNAYAIIDSGHGFKMLALGRLAADDVLEGEPRLEPFRLSRFARGATHTPSRGPYPWT